MFELNLDNLPGKSVKGKKHADEIIRSMGLDPAHNKLVILEGDKPSKAVGDDNEASVEGHRVFVAANEVADTMLRVQKEKPDLRVPKHDDPPRQVE